MMKKKPEKARNIKVSGIIIPADWDSNGKVKTYAISTFNEKEYFIRRDDSEGLKCFLGKKVNVEGVLTKSATVKTIEIKTISII